MNKETIQQLVYERGAEVIGIGNVNNFEKAPEGFHPRDILANANSVIVYGKQILKGVSEARAFAPYTLMRNKTIVVLDDISMHLISFGWNYYQSKKMPRVFNLVFRGWRLVLFMF